MSRGIYKCRVEYRWRFINVAWNSYTSVGIYKCSAGFIYHGGDFAAFIIFRWRFRIPLRGAIQRGQRSSDDGAERR